MNLKKLSFFILIFLQFSTFKLFSENVTFSATQILTFGSSVQIITDGSGRFVYITTILSPGLVQVFYSSDFGQTFTDADPLGSIFGTGNNSVIKTDSTGQFVDLIVQGGAAITGPIKTFASTDFGVTWTDTTDGSFGNGRGPLKITDSSGKFVYITWENTTDDIKIFASSDFGQTWTDTTDGSFGKGNFPIITTNSSGQFVYLIWPDFASNTMTTFVSSDFGQTWTNTTSGSFGDGKNSPAIVTDNSGQNVYAIWSDFTTDEIKIFISSDFGATWSQASASFGDGSFLQITTDSSGKYIYAIWKEDLTDDLKIFFSSDFGATWNAVPDSFGDGFRPQIITDSSGRYIYAIWQETALSSAIKIFYSTDFGQTWVNADPSSILFGTGRFSQITTNSTGRYAYGAWSGTIFIEITNGIRSFFPITNMGIIR